MKTLLKNIFIPLFASRMVSAVTTSVFGRGILVFLLHRPTTEKNGLNGTSPEHLRTCLRYLTDDNYTFLSLEELLIAIIHKQPLAEKSVVFTMDDGFLDQAEILAPIFLEFNCPLTFFVISDLLEQKIWPWDAQVSWLIDNTKKDSFVINFPDEQLQVNIDHKTKRHRARELVRNYFKEVDAKQVPTLLQQLAEVTGLELPFSPPEQYLPMDWDKARALEKQGVRFAPHSVSHQILSKLDRETARHEIIDSWQKLQTELENPLNVFCYPTGRVLDFGPREIEILKQNNFLGAVTTSPGYVEPDAESNRQLFRIPRFELPNNMADFIQYCSWIEYAKRSSNKKLF